ncbi:hypothetical protein [Methanoculleus sp. UBA416]|uniref:Uncharacterized protein n=1 Tax=Methanoculleus palmolei TaxID=72612 RepID=A0ABD8ABM4_9EURY|nr:hypothetical protein R6Y95_04160 [Methanoculleus palmolei]
MIIVLSLLFAFTETVPPGNFYAIEITDLPVPAVNGTATVMVPVPANTTGTLVIPDEVLTGNQVSGWQAEIRETPYGRMLAFTAAGEYAPDISVSFEVVQTGDEERAAVARTCACDTR